jgi:hypothetical protein
MFPPAVLNAQGSTYYVATNGSDTTGDGSSSRPWATIRKAFQSVQDGDLVLVRPGTYNGTVVLRDRSLTQGITIRSEIPYKAQLRTSSLHTVKVVSVSGITFEGFDLAHSGPGAGPLVMQVDCYNGQNPYAGQSRITIRNNVFHDSYSNDLLKVNNGCRNVLVEGNMFYNQSGWDEHIDINGVDGVTVQDNVFFNDFEGSGRTNDSSTANFIVIKDSNGNEDGFYGAWNVTVRRNVFLNYQGNAGAGFLRLGEDGYSYWEAQNVLVENNLMLGNASNKMSAPFTVSGSRNVTFRNNTVTGNLPAGAYVTWITKPDMNQPSENVQFYNNVYADQTGTMLDFSNTRPANVGSFTLSNNLYWNGGNAIPIDTTEDVINYTNDARRIMANPLLAQPTSVTPPRWVPANNAFADGSTTIEQVRARLIDTYAKPGAGSPVIDRADATNAASEDIRRTPRGSAPDVGAYEAGTVDPPPSVTVTSPANGTTVSDIVTMTANASDNVGVAGVQFFVDGIAQGPEDNVAPYSYELDLIPLANGNHTITARARDTSGNTSTSSPVTVTVSNSCSDVTQGQTLSNLVAGQTGTFTAKWTSKPGQNMMDGGVGMSLGQQTYWAGAAAIVLYDTTGKIVVRDYSAYAASVDYPYSAGTRYRFRMVVNVPNKTYSVWVRLANGSETQLGTNYRFRDTQQVSTLDHWMARVDSASVSTLQVCNFRVE